MNQRRDILTNKSYDREELIRISILKNGETSIDKEFTLGGRGIYIHPSSLKKTLDKKILERHIKRFNGDFSQIKDLIIQEVNNG